MGRMAVTTVEAGGFTFLARCRMCNWRHLALTRLAAWTEAAHHEAVTHDDLPAAALMASRRVRYLKARS